MSIEIPKNSPIHTQAMPSQRPIASSFEGVLKQQQNSSSQEISPKIPVDYSTLTNSKSAQDLQAVLISDKDISKLVHDILSQQQDFSPVGLNTKEALNPFQSDVAQLVKQNGHPTPRAFIA